MKEADKLRQVQAEQTQKKRTNSGRYRQSRRKRSGQTPADTGRVDAEEAEDPGTDLKQSTKQQQQQHNVRSS